MSLLWHLEKGSQGPVDLGFEPTEAERRPYVIHQSGKWYTNENIDQMLIVWMLIKQGGKSLKEAIDYVKKPENRKKSFGVLMLEIGKIVTAGLTAAGALVLGEVIEKSLMTVPVFAFEIPLIGSLANIIGIFLGAVVAGIAGALVMNLLDKLIAKKQKQEITEKQIDKGNEVLAKQAQVIAVNEEKLRRTKDSSLSTIKERHEAAAELMKQSTDFILSGRKALENCKI